MGILLLTSTGLSDPTVLESFQKLANEDGLHSVAVVTTASEGKEENKYAKLAKGQLESLGFEAAFADLEEQPDFDFSGFDTIYVCGGNAFKLLKFAQAADFGTTIQSLLKRGGAYIGVSAGTLILSPTIDVANEITPDPNEIGLEDLTAFNLVSFHVAVHFDEEHEAEVAAFEKKHGTTVERLSNSQAILVSGDTDPERIG